MGGVVTGGVTGDVEIEAIALLDAQVTTHRSGQGAIFQ